MPLRCDRLPACAGVIACLPVRVYPARLGDLASACVGVRVCVLDSLPLSLSISPILSCLSFRV
jgi:hypothetical protein